MSYKMTLNGVQYRIIDHKDTRKSNRSSVAIPSFVWSSDLTEANNTICGIDISEFVILGKTTNILWNAK